MAFKKSKMALCAALIAVMAPVSASASEVRVIINGESSCYTTNDKTVREFFKNNGIELEKSSRINVGLDDAIAGNTRIVIESPLSINIYVDGEFKEVFNTNVDTVAKAAAHYRTSKGNKFMQYTPADLDGNTKITDGMDVYLTSIEDRFETDTVEVPYETVRTESDELEIGTEKVEVNGVNGSVSTTRKIHYVGGVQQGEPEVTSVIEKNPVNEEILVGTHDTAAEEAARKAKEEEEKKNNSNVYVGTSSSFTYSKVMTMNASAYAPVVACCGKSDGITASGMRAGYGVVAVDPRYIKLGTKLYVEGYGYCVAGDTGGAIKGYKIDLCYNTYNEALNYGRKNVKVYVLD